MRISDWSSDVCSSDLLDEKTVRDIFNARAEFLGRWHRFETPRILGIDELYLNKRYRCILTNIEERTLLDLLATRRQDVVTNYLKIGRASCRERVCQYV